MSDSAAIAGPGGFELEPGRNCWRAATAERATPLIDAAAYFSMLYETMRRAERQILIVGWDIHALTCLKPDASKDPAGLRELLVVLARRNRTLDVRILLWDFTVLYSPDRLPFPKAVLDWSMPPNVRLAFDGRLPIGAAQHQKIVVIDDRVAFIGGIDLTEARWDTPEHAKDDERRVTALGRPYGPFHDVQLAVSGRAAASLGELCRMRWRECTGEAVAEPEAGGDPWPETVEPVWREVEVGLARTVPPVGEDDAPVREILELYVDSLRSARRCIYLENQYLTSDRICDVLAERLGEPDGPEVVLVTRFAVRSWLEQNTMGIRRGRFLKRLRAADAHGRLRALAPSVPGLELSDYKLHSKVAVVDDCLVRIGTANLNNRSMGFDAECDAVVRCRSKDDREAAATFRDTLLAEHLGARVARVSRAIAQTGSVIAAIESLHGGGRDLVELAAPDEEVEHDEMLPELGDLERPLTARDLLERLAPESGPSTRPLRSVVAVALALTVVVALAIAWRFTGLHELADPAVMAGLLRRTPDGALGALVAVTAFVLGGLVVFPVTVLIFATAVAFGAWPGIVYAMLGTYLSAAATFGVGHWIGRKTLRRWPSTTVANVSRQLTRHGMIAIALVRIVPVAPFTVVNVVAGASRVRFRDYALGTILGMTPGIAVLTAMGGQVGTVLRDPSIGQILILGALGLLWVGVGIGLYRLIQRLERRRAPAEDA